MKIKNYIVYGIVTKIIIRKSDCYQFSCYSLDKEIDKILRALSKLFPISNYSLSQVEDYYLLTIDHCFLIRQIAKYKKCDMASFLSADSFFGVEGQSDEDYSGYLLQYTYDKWDWIEIKFSFIPILSINHCCNYLNLFLLHCNFLEGIMVFIKD